MNMVQGILGGLRPAVIAMIASAGISLLLMAIYGQKNLPANVTSVDGIALVLFFAGFMVLRKWKLNPISVIIGSGIAGVILYTIF